MTALSCRITTATHSFIDGNVVGLQFFLLRFRLDLYFLILQVLSFIRQLLSLVSEVSLQLLDDQLGFFELLLNNLEFADARLTLLDGLVG